MVSPIIQAFAIGKGVREKRGQDVCYVHPGMVFGVAKLSLQGFFQKLLVERRVVSKYRVAIHPLQKKKQGIFGLMPLGKRFRPYTVNQYRFGDIQFGAPQNQVKLIAEVNCASIDCDCTNGNDFILGWVYSLAPFCRSGPYGDVQSTV